MTNQTEGKNQPKTYQPEIGAFVEQFLTLISLTVQNSVNSAAQNIINELNQKKQLTEIDTSTTDGYITRAQVAELLHISYPTLHRYQCQGLIPVVRVGRKCLYNQVEVLDSLKNVGKKKVRSVMKG